MLELPLTIPDDQILDLLFKGKQIYTPKLEGNFYETYILSVDGQTLMVKALKPSDVLPKDTKVQNRAELFALHQDEYQQMRAAFKGTDMVLPTVFISDFDRQTFLSVQSFVPNPVAQYKLWERRIDTQLPQLSGEAREQVAKALNEVERILSGFFDQIHPLLIDVDFFILDEAPWVVIFDTSHFWPDKMEGKDRMRKEYLLGQYRRALLGEE